ncbi:MAG: hypothetical protein JW795_13320 [Chitinivibrionales bacterium]|nr:hypothetical protein [Chitinivibrionales bacterium]
MKGTIWYALLCSALFITIQCSKNGTGPDNETTVSIFWIGGKQIGMDSLDEIFHWDGNTIYRLTSNAYCDYGLRHSGGKAVWAGSGSIYLWNKSAVSTVANDCGIAPSPDISGDNVIWEKNGEVFLWNGTSIRQITDNTHYCLLPRISGNAAAWFSTNPKLATAEPGKTATRRHNICDIFYWNGTDVSQLTHNAADYWVGDPQVSDDMVTWLGRSYEDDNWIEIFIWDHKEIRQITDNHLDDAEYKISGKNIAWSGGIDDADNTFDIYLWDGSATRRLTNDSLVDWYVQIADSKLVWVHGDYENRASFEIIYWDGATARQITTNAYEDCYPQVSSKGVVWVGFPKNNNKGEIFFWDGATVRQITSDSENFCNSEPIIY